MQDMHEAPECSGQRQACRCLAIGKAAPAGPDARGMGFPVEPVQQRAGPETESPATLQAALLPLGRKGSATGQGQPQERQPLHPKCRGHRQPCGSTKPTLTPALAGDPSSPPKASQQNKPGGLGGTSSENTNSRGVKAS